MDATTVAIDLAKDVFEVAIGNRGGQVLHRHRFTRARLQRFLEGQAAGTEVLMEACGTAHHWGRLCQRLQLVPVLLPVQYVRAYVRRNKSDRTDAAALLEARRCGEIAPVPVKTPEQQAWQGLHRIRQQWQKTRTARINGLRGLLREYGIVVGLGARRLHAHVPAIVTTEEAPVPGPLLAALQTLLEEIRELERRIKALDATLVAHLATDDVGQRLQTIPGVGPITASALLASVPHIHQFRRGRQFASWLGLTPREAASGHRVWRGRITKRGDVYLRTLLIHGARSVIRHAHAHARQAHVALTARQRWVLALVSRRGVNKAATAFANHQARVIWAVWRSEQPYRCVATP